MFILANYYAEFVSCYSRNQKDGWKKQNYTIYKIWNSIISIHPSIGVATLSAQEDFTTVSGALFFVPAVFSIVAGTIFLMWLGEQVSERGIGNGISIIIATSILTGIPGAIGQALTLSSKGELSVLVLLGIGLLSMAIIAVVVYVERGQRRITNYAQRQQGRRLMENNKLLHFKGIWLLFPQFLQVLSLFLLLYQHEMEKMIPQVFLRFSLALNQDNLYIL